MVNESQKKEFERWQAYANALLLASTVVFAGTAVAFPKAVEFTPIFSAIFGLLAILSAVLWHAFEWKVHVMGNKPLLLIVASVGFGIQIGAMLVALIIAYQSAVTSAVTK